jgi:hypothetical protein
VFCHEMVLLRTARGAKKDHLMAEHAGRSNYPDSLRMNPGFARTARIFSGQCALRSGSYSVNGLMFTQPGAFDPDRRT